MDQEKTRGQAAVQTQTQRSEGHADAPGPEPANSERVSEEMSAEERQREADTEIAIKKQVVMLRKLRDLQVELLNASDHTEKARIQAAIQGQMRRLGRDGEDHAAAVVGRAASGISL